MIMKVLDIGTIVKFHGIRLQVVKAVDGCRGCYFKHQKLCHASIVGACSPPFRFDEVIFRKYDKNKKENLHGKNLKRRNRNHR